MRNRETWGGLERERESVCVRARGERERGKRGAYFRRTLEAGVLGLEQLEPFCDQPELLLLRRRGGIPLRWAGQPFRRRPGLPLCKAENVTCTVSM